MSVMVKRFKSVMDKFFLQGNFAVLYVRTGRTLYVPNGKGFMFVMDKLVLKGNFALF